MEPESRAEGGPSNVCSLIGPAVSAPLPRRRVLCERSSHVKHPLPYRRRTNRTMTTLSQTKEFFRRAEAVCFDVDSTVIKEEGIDELAKFCGVGDAVTEMTRKAMGGSVTFKTALTERLSIIRCSREQVNKLITDHPPQLTPGIRELVDRLHQRNIKVFLISGGFRCIVEHVATQLNIPLHHVYANRLKFYFNGEYAGFDESQPTAESGGKGKVISMLKEQYGLKTVVMIGDGATDLEACPPANAFIGFGGNVIRPQVKERCSWFFNDNVYTSETNFTFMEMLPY
ncbi:hypothetical protein F2P81_017199 [Scophthalmus maximus]|uniref:Phosphoserine phosphatase n=1 Tax=Scophthalmus maximus TaxID=52904 RepID=A0A6A4SDZ1_SCOMX|nr:hypothetical protein F2P81_017199 [Scophthalmus maximus]